MRSQFHSHSPRNFTLRRIPDLDKLVANGDERECCWVVQRGDYGHFVSQLWLLDLLVVKERQLPPHTHQPLVAVNSHEPAERANLLLLGPERLNAAEVSDVPNFEAAFNVRRDHNRRVGYDLHAAKTAAVIVQPEDEVRNVWVPHEDVEIEPDGNQEPVLRGIG